MSSPENLGQTQPISVLVVDDDADLCEQLVGLFGAYGMTTRGTGTFDTALAIVAADHPDAVVLDRWLGSVDSVPLIGRMRAITHAPILVLTGQADEVDRIIALEQGADDVMTKPTSGREIVARLRAQLRRYFSTRDSGPAADAAAAPGWRADPLRRQVFAPGGELVPLTAAEFDLLATLGADPGVPVSRAALTERVLRRPLHQDDRSIDNLVYQVRKKLHPFGAHMMLATVRNQGYASAIPLLRD